MWDTKEKECRDNAFASTNKKARKTTVVINQADEKATRSKEEED